MSSDLFIQELEPSLDVLSTLERFGHEPVVLLLDSAAHIRERDARYTFLTADPVDVSRLDRCQYGVDPFAQIRQWKARLPRLPANSTPPFCGGVAGLMSYELGHAFERLPSRKRDDFKTPDLLAGLFDWCIVWDHIERTVKLYVLAFDGHSIDQRQAQRRIEWVRQKLDIPVDAAGVGVPAAESRTTPPFMRQTGSAVESVTGVRSNFETQDYLAAVDRVIEYIRAGDIFQANLSQQLTAAWPDSVIELYRRVRQHNPAPFCALLCDHDFSVVSASPERFLRVDAGGHVETRPIKGTRRRHRSPIADLFTSDELSASEKDRAENIMIVDLLRNDISRVCVPGSVRVTGLCEIELFETVQHLVSTVEGQLTIHADVWDLCAACFPGGSITGAPKIRAMEIISELEPAVRGAYCGSIFYCGPAGHFDSSILIRTFTVRDGWAQFPVGGGIVADSNAADEYAETLHKASGMLRTLLRT